MDNGIPSTIVLISGDRDFAYALSILRLRRYRVVLIALSNAHPSLIAQASLCFNWVSDVVEPAHPTLNLFHQSISPRRGKTSLPPAHKKFPLESKGHNPSGYPLHESYDERPRSADRIEFMDYFQDAVRRRENSLTPSKHNARHGFLSPDLEQSKRKSAASSVASNTSRSRPEFPTRVIHSPAASSCHTYPSGSIETPSTITSHNSNSSQTKSTSKTSVGSTLEFATYENIIPSKYSFHSGSPILAQNKGGKATEPVSYESTMKTLLPESVPSSQQQDTYSLSNSKIPSLSTYRINSYDCDPASLNATTPRSASAPSSMSFSDTSLPTVAQSSVEGDNPRQSTSLPFVPEKFKILVQCLTAQRAKGRLRILRSEIALQIARNGTTYRKAGVLKFSQYVAMAERAGIVELGGQGLVAWIALRDAWYNPLLS